AEPGAASPRTRRHPVADTRRGCASGSGLRRGQRLSQPPGDVLNELPCHAPRARAAGGGPFEGRVLHLGARHVEAEIVGIAVDHREIVFLRALVEAEPETEAIRQRYLL